MSEKNHDTQELIHRHEEHYDRVRHLFHIVLHTMEHFIAVLTTAVLIISMVIEISHMFTSGSYFSDFTTYLHHILNLVIGLEFVRMLVDTTPASILEVLTVAITRYILLNHEDPWSNVAGVICIAGLFAIRRFLIPSSELKEELNDNK